MADYRNDVVHRLQDRAFASEQFARVVSNTHYHLRDNNHGRDATLMREAADEIERLRAEVARLQHEADAAAERHVTIAETRADIAERELAALRERIEMAPSATTGSPWQDNVYMTWFAIFSSGVREANPFIAGKRVRLVRED